MSIKNQYHICQCKNPLCRLRFPAPTQTGAPSSCPACGEPLVIANNDYANTKPGSQPHIGNDLSISIALDNLRSAYNVGAIFRTADAVGIDHIHLYGITPTPENPKIQKTSLSAEFAVPWTHHNNGLDHINVIKTKYLICAIEGGQDAVSLFVPHLQTTKQPILLIFGSEYAGIDPAILSLAHQRIFIPMVGFKRSLNVASAFAITAYTLRFNTW